MNDLFDSVVRIGYGKNLCQFLDSADAANLEMVNKQCHEIIPIHRERWGFKPGFSENMWGQMTLFFGKEIYKTSFRVCEHSTKHYQSRKGNIFSFRSLKYGNILNIIIPDENMYLEIIKSWKFFSVYESRWLRQQKHNKKLEIYKAEQERIKELKFQESLAQEKMKLMCRITNICCFMPSSIWHLN